MDSLQAYQVISSVKPKIFNTITANHVGDIIQSDLMDVSNYSTKNNNIKFLLTFIDVYSRYVMLIPLKNKNMNTVSKAMDKLIKESKEKIVNITTDDGSEFNNKQMKQIMYNHKIKH